MKLLRELKVQEDLSTGNGERTVFDAAAMFPNGVADVIQIGVKCGTLGTGTTKNIRVEADLDGGGVAISNMLLSNIASATTAESFALPASGASDLLNALIHTNLAWFPFGFFSVKLFLDEDYDTGLIDFIMSFYDTAQVSP